MPYFQTDKVHIQLVGLAAAKQFFEPMFFARDKEVLHAALLDEELRVKGLQTFEGEEGQTEVSVTKFLREAVKLEANAVIMAHNHPSGLHLPSRADQTYTRTTADFCNHLDITLIDHLIFGSEGKCYSFRDAGVLG